MKIHFMKSITFIPIALAIGFMLIQKTIKTNNLRRLAPKLSVLFESFSPETLESLVYSELLDGTFVGYSTCDRFTSALGGGQNVVSYSYYSPWQNETEQT